MTDRRRFLQILASIIVTFFMVSSVRGQNTRQPRTAEEILDATDAKGGLIIHVGCGDGKLAAALRAGNRYLVHGIDRDPENVEKARRYIRSAGLYGAVSVDRFDGEHLPYIIDEGLRNHIYLPARWAVVARDAFNGTILWKRSIDQWFPHIWPFKSGPGHLPRRIVAVDNRVYVTLGITAPLSVLDAATGETIRTYDQTKSTEEIVLAGGNLFLAGPPDVADEEKTYGFVFGGDDEINRQMDLQEQAWQGKQGALLWVVSADTGRKLSEQKIAAIPVWDGMIATGGRLYLALKNGTVLCVTGQ